MRIISSIARVRANLRFRGHTSVQGLLLLLLLFVSSVARRIIPYPSPHRNIIPTLSLQKQTEENVVHLNSKSTLVVPLLFDLDFTWILSASFAGAVSCSFTHSVMVPLDFIKTTMQSLAGPSSSPLKIVNFHRMFTGLSATFTGYFLQGGFKFGFYELLKSEVQSKLLVNRASNWEIPLLVGASAVAETIASVALCPLEVTKIYMMLNPEKSVEGMSACIRSIFASEGVAGLYKGLPWVLLRQLPYTCVKLVGYDVIHQYILDFKACAINSERKQKQQQEYKETTRSKPKSECVSEHKHDSPLIQALSGVLAGLLAAIVSQPADVILSQVCSRSSDSTTCLVIDTPSVLWKYIIHDLGLKGCFSGLAPRAVMVSAMTAMQFVLYENAKQWTFRYMTRLQNNLNQRSYLVSKRPETDASA